MTDQSKGDDYYYGKKIAQGCIIATGVWYTAPIIVSSLGFKTGGIAAGSWATSLMSTLGGGTTAKGGVIATLQSTGAVGAISKSTAVIAGSVGTLAAPYLPKLPSGSISKLSSKL